MSWPKNSQTRPRVNTAILNQNRDTSDMERKPGRRPKGDRYQITCRVPVDYQPVLEKAAADAGLAMSDYVAVVLAKHHDLSIPSYTQETLPIGA